MPYNSKERLEREALESLVAADLSAKMKQWRNAPPAPPNPGMGNSMLRILLLLLALGGAAWLFWPKTERVNPAVPAEHPPEITQPKQQTLPPAQAPVAQKTTPATNRYLALAQASYHAPDFAGEIRGSTPTAQDALNDARHALAEQRFSDALNALQNIGDDYKTDAAYLRGHALLGLKKYPQAAATFGQLTGSVRYGEAAQWYEALALLPDFEQHKTLVLKKLKLMSTEEGHTFQREAAKLLAQIE